jgi:TRAP-type C4-dicarboxylate transport system substrate-binding protein
VTNNLTLVGSLYSPHLVMMSKIFFDGLSAEHQELINTAFADMQKFQRSKIRENEADILKKLGEKGMTVVELSEDERNQWRAAAQPVLDEFAGEIGAELIEKARKTIADAGL